MANITSFFGDGVELFDRRVNFGGLPGLLPDICGHQCCPGDSRNTTNSLPRPEAESPAAKLRAQHLDNQQCKKFGGCSVEKLRFRQIQRCKNREKSVGGCRDVGK